MVVAFKPVPEVVQLPLLMLIVWLLLRVETNLMLRMVVALVFVALKVMFLGPTVVFKFEEIDVMLAVGVQFAEVV